LHEVRLVSRQRTTIYVFKLLCSFIPSGANPTQVQDSPTHRLTPACSVLSQHEAVSIGHPCFRWSRYFHWRLRHTKHGSHRVDVWSCDWHLWLGPHQVGLWNMIEHWGFWATIVQVRRGLCKFQVFKVIMVIEVGR